MRITKVVLCISLLVGAATRPIETTAQAGPDEIGQGITQGYLTQLRAAIEMARPSRTRQWYELSHPWSQTMPYHPLVGPLTVSPIPTTPFGQLEAANSEHVTGFINHAGTQLDALGHYTHLSVPGNPDTAVYYNGFQQSEVKPTADSPLLRLGMEKAPPIITTAILLDARGYFGGPLEAGNIITAAHLKAMLKRQRVRQILPGDAVLVYTGWERHWQDPDVSGVYYSSGPGLSEDAARFLASKQVVAIGMDVPYIDPSPPPPPSGGITFVVHHIALVEEGIHLIENMHLAELAQDRVWVSALMVLPIRVLGGSGSPVRPVALGVPHRHR